MTQLLVWLGIPASEYYDWCKRYGQPNAHNAAAPRQFWLLPEERQAILNFACEYPDEGYRRLSFMMLDADVVVASPKGHGFDQPGQVHAHWHIDVSYLNICGTLYYWCTILIGYSGMHAAATSSIGRSANR
jgi:hypothetical protein